MSDKPIEIIAEQLAIILAGDSNGKVDDRINPLSDVINGAHEGLSAGANATFLKTKDYIQARIKEDPVRETARFIRGCFLLVITNQLEREKQNRNSISDDSLEELYREQRSRK